MLSTRSGLSKNGMPLFFEGDAGDPYEDEELDGEDVEEEAPRANSHFEDLFSSAEDEPEVTEMLVEGRLVTTTHRVELMYEELHDDGFGASITKIGFDRACPEMVTLLRSGTINTALVFESRKRHLCIYNVPSADFEICISTVLVDNRLLTDGVLNLDYYMEIHGVQTDHCKMELTIRDAE